MSATRSSTATGDRTPIMDGEQAIAVAHAKHSVTTDATPALFVTSEMPHRESWKETASMTISNNAWNVVWTAADSGELDPSQGAEDQGDLAEAGVLTGLMLERFDDDEHWRELSRTGRAL